MVKKWDKKFWIGIFFTIFTLGTGGVSAFYKVQNDNNEKILERISDAEAQIKKESAEKFATKEEIFFIKQTLIDLKDGMNTANARLFEIQKTMISESSTKRKK